MPENLSGNRVAEQVSHTMRVPYVLGLCARVLQWLVTVCSLLKASADSIAVAYIFSSTHIKFLHVWPARSKLGKKNQIRSLAQYVTCGLWKPMSHLQRDYYKAVEMNSSVCQSCRPPHKTLLKACEVLC